MSQAGGSNGRGRELAASALVVILVAIVVPRSVTRAAAIDDAREEGMGLAMNAAAALPSRDSTVEPVKLLLCDDRGRPDREHRRAGDRTSRQDSTRAVLRSGKGQVRWRGRFRRQPREGESHGELEIVTGDSILRGSSAADRPVIVMALACNSFDEVLFRDRAESLEALPSGCAIFGFPARREGFMEGP